MSERTYSPRGFAQHQPIRGAYGGTVRAYESSAASAPHVWVNVIQADQEKAEATIHLDLPSARQLVADLTDLIENHYHFQEAADERR